MFKSRYITNNEYNSMREALLSNDTNVVKMAIQNFVVQFENERKINFKCKKDLSAILFTLVQNNDYKIRKWAYHLAIYVNTPSLINQCLENLKVGFEQDCENISWIISILSCASSHEYVERLYNEYAKGIITPNAFNICSSIFSKDDNIFTLNKGDINKIIDSDDFISKMWITKMYACNYNKKMSYSDKIDYNVMNSLLNDVSVQRYALWAFSAVKDVELSKIAIPSYNVERLPAKSLAWYYNALFKDNKYIVKNLDHVQSILTKFWEYPQVVRLGILRGLESCSYDIGAFSDLLMDIYCELDETQKEHKPLILSLTKLFIINEHTIPDLVLILNDQFQNTKWDRLIALLLLRNNVTKESGKMQVNIYGSGANVQNVEGNTTKVIQKNSTWTSDLPNQMEKDLSELKLQIDNGDFDTSLSNDDKIDNFITNMQHEIAKNMFHNDISNISDNLKKISSTLDELVKAKRTDRKKILSDILVKISTLCTIMVNLPESWSFLQNIFKFIKNLLSI